MSKQSLKTVFSFFLARKLIYAPPASEHKTLYLTFDDGPCADSTNALLDLLDKLRVRATFFLTGSNIVQSPQIVERIFSAGHTLGNHGYLHATPAEIGRRAYLQGIDQTQELMEQAAGKSLPLFFRPPFGALTLGTVPAILWRGYQIVMWNHDSQDSFLNPGEALNAAADQFLHFSSAITLLHDDHPKIIDLTAYIVKRAEDEGYTLKALDNQLTPDDYCS